METETIAKCTGCNAENVTYQLVEDDGDHHWECENCGYKVANLLEVWTKKDKTDFQELNNKRMKIRRDRTRKNTYTPRKKNP